MKKILLLYIIFNAALSCIYGQSNTIPSANKISIRYDYFPVGTSALLSAAGLNQSNLFGGINYNQGVPLKLSIMSGAPYFINVSSRNSSYTPFVGGGIVNPQDIRNYILLKIINNETGGQVLDYSSSHGFVLGQTEKTIIRNCQPTLSVQSVSIERSFALLFKIIPGYSIPPGSYSTPVIITATFE
jgi:hypothetical protein